MVCTQSNPVIKGKPLPAVHPFELKIAVSRFSVDGEAASSLFRL